MTKIEQPKLHKGIFCFLSNRGHILPDMQKMLRIYALTLDKTRPKKNRLKWYSEISVLASNDFANFKKLYNKNKKSFSVYESYEDWYDRCNMDGSFAYNGIADTF